jgi:hypothetical protein
VDCRSKQQHIKKTYKSLRTNTFISLTQQGRWRNEALEEVMDVVKKSQTFLKKIINNFWHILLTFLLNHLNG